MPQPGGRTYDPALVDAIAAGVHTVEFDGIDEEVRPIPDEDRENVLDPRILDTTLKKMAGLIPSASAGGIVCQRHFLKETHLINEGRVEKTLEIADFGDRCIPITVLTPASKDEHAPVLVFTHGGGFTVGWFGTYEAALTLVADLAGCVVVFPEVRLAPECRYPAQVDDCEATVRWVQDNAERLGIDPARIAVAGDSAGGSLCNATVLRCAPDIVLAIPIYAGMDVAPVPDWWGYDLYPVVPEQADAARNRIDNTKSWPDELWLYVGDDPELCRSPDISAAYATPEQLACFPRTVVVCSEYDYLRVQDERFAAQLARAGVDVRLVRYAGMEHGFLEICGTCPQSEDLCRLIADEIRTL